jgi:phosphate-selective porin OprO/OprP
MSMGLSSTNLMSRWAKTALAALAMLLWLATYAHAESPDDSSWLTPYLVQGAAPQPPLPPLPPQNATPDANSEVLELPVPQNPANAEVTPIAPEAELPSPTDELDAIMQRLDALEKSMAKPAEEEKPAEEKKAAEKEPIDDWIDLSTEKWTVKLGGHIQMDQICWADHDPQVPAFNYFEFRRLRLMADGVGYGVYDFRIQIDIEPENGDGTDRPVTHIKDAYFTLHELPNPIDRWRIGNFFVPFGLEQVTNDTNNIFLERSIPTQGIFTADREVGVATYGVNDAKNFTWTFGTFYDSISESLKERIDDNQGQRISGRLTYLPYYDEPSNGRYLVHTGAGLLYTKDQDGIARFRARPQIHEGPFLIDSGPLAAGEYTTSNVELATVWGPFAMQSEAFLSNVNMIAADSELLWGAYVHCSYFLTGENRVYERYGQHGAQFGRQQVFSNFFWVPGCCGPGAWELKARWSNLTLTEIDSGQYNDITTGFNWYWSDRVRVMFDYIHPVTAEGTTPFGATTSDIIGMRFDVNW